MDAMPSPEPLLPTLVETYLARCAVEGKSPRTIDAYRESLSRFRRCLEEDGAPLDPDRIRPDHVIAYLVRFAALSPDTRHRYFREVRCFCNWLRAAGYTDNDPFRGLRNVRLPRKIVPPLGPAEIARLIACCDGATVVGRRDRAILLTLLDTGVRCAEAVGLDLADCTLPERRLLVRHGKGGKERVVPFAGRCGDALAAYLLDRGTVPGPLFVAARYGRLNDGVRLRPNGLKQLLRRLGRARVRGSTPTASATRSPPGPSPTTPARSMCSTCSATAPRRWCAATAPRTAAPRPPSATPPSRRGTGCWALRADRPASSPAPAPSLCLLLGTRGSERGARTSGPLERGARPSGSTPRNQRWAHAPRSPRS